MIGPTHFVIPMLLGTLIFLWNLGGRASLDGHEVLVAQTAREMVETGDWLIPQFSGEVRLQKPPLAYWLAAATYQLTGLANEFTARLPSAVASILLVGLVAWYSGHAFGRTVGLYAGVIQVTTVWSVWFGKQAIVDATLTLLIAVAITALTFDRLPKARIPADLAVLLFWLCSGLAVLAKGPVALGVIFPIAFIYRAFRPPVKELKPEAQPREFTPEAQAREWKPQGFDQRFWMRWSTLVGMALFLVCALVWPWLVVRRHPEAGNLWLAQSVGRFAEHYGPNTRPWSYYLYTVAWLCLPWLPLALVALWRSNRQARHDDHRWLLLVWLLWSLMFFSLSAGKREHYILPGLVPLSILAALGAADLLVKRPYTTSGNQPADPLQTDPTSGLCVRFGNNFRSNPARFWVAAASAVATVLVFETWLVPALFRQDAALQLFERNRERLISCDRLIQFGTTDRWAIFPIDRPMRWPRSVEQLTAELPGSQSPLILVPEQRLNELLTVIKGEVLDRADKCSSADRRGAGPLVLLRPTQTAAIAVAAPTNERR